MSSLGMGYSAGSHRPVSCTGAGDGIRTRAARALRARQARRAGRPILVDVAGAPPPHPWVAGSNPFVCENFSMTATAFLERETGFEPATNSLEGCDSTPELLPRVPTNALGPNLFMEPKSRFELLTPSLPRTCSTN